MATIDDLLAAVRARDAVRTSALLAETPSLAAERPAAGPSAILMACYVSAPECVALLRTHAPCDLFEASALGDLAAMQQAWRVAPHAMGGRSGDGWSALHLAGFFGRTEAARWLLDQGADIEAISSGPEANRPLHAALAGAGDPAFVALLVQRGADVRATGASAITPLHIAASRGSDHFVDLLVAQGALAHATMADGREPADLAGERGFPVLADRLRAMR
jgi:hypothetical protein